MRFLRATRWMAATATLLLFGCDRLLESETIALEIFPVEVRVTGPVGTNLDGIPVTFSRNDRLTTNAKGRLRVNYQGAAGGKLHIAIDVPERLKALGPMEREFDLGHTAEGQPAPVRFILPVKPVAKAKTPRPKQGDTKFVVVVDTDCEGQPVSVDGESLGVTDEDGYLEKSFVGTPGRRVQIVAESKGKCPKVQCGFSLRDGAGILNVEPGCGAESLRADGPPPLTPAPDPAPAAMTAGALAASKLAAAPATESPAKESPPSLSPLPPKRSKTPPAAKKKSKKEKKKRKIRRRAKRVVRAERSPPKRSSSKRSTPKRSSPKRSTPNRSSSKLVAAAAPDDLDDDDFEWPPPSPPTPARRPVRPAPASSATSVSATVEVVVPPSPPPRRVAAPPPPREAEPSRESKPASRTEPAVQPALAAPSTARRAEIPPSGSVQRSPASVTTAARGDEPKRPPAVPDDSPPLVPLSKSNVRPAAAREEPIRPADGRRTTVSCEPAGLDLYVDGQLAARGCGVRSIAYLSPGVRKLTMSGAACRQTRPTFVEVPAKGRIEPIRVAGKCKSDCTQRVRQQLRASGRPASKDLACLRRFTARQPKYIEAKLMLAHVYTTQGDAERAEQVLTEALRTRRGRSDPELRVRLAELLGRRRRLRQASKQAEAAWRYRMKFRGTRAQRQRWILNTLKLRAGFFEQLFYSQEELNYYEQAIATLQRPRANRAAVTELGHGGVRAVGANPSRGSAAPPGWRVMRRARDRTVPRRVGHPAAGWFAFSAFPARLAFAVSIASAWAGCARNEPAPSASAACRAPADDWLTWFIRHPEGPQVVRYGVQGMGGAVPSRLSRGRRSLRFSGGGVRTTSSTGSGGPERMRALSRMYERLATLHATALMDYLAGSEAGPADAPRGGR